MVNWVKGDKLPPRLQRQALRRFVNRHTKEHIPIWAQGTDYMPQFENDADWLANTEFAITQDCRIADRPNHCHSTPTWSDREGEHNED